MAERTSSWKADLTVGIRFMDEEHELLRIAIEELRHAVPAAGGDTTTAVRASLLVEKITVQTRQHFAHEQAVMTRYGYPNTHDHTAQHENFLRQLEELRQAFADDLTTGIAPRTARVVQAWFARHILDSDRPLADWLAAQQIDDTDAVPGLPLDRPRGDRASGAA